MITLYTIFFIIIRIKIIPVITKTIMIPVININILIHVINKGLLIHIDIPTKITICNNIEVAMENIMEAAIMFVGNSTDSFN